MTNEEFNEGMRKRTKVFAVAVLKYCAGLPQTSISRIIIYQLCKSATSVGSNFRAFCRGRSHRERYAKICIAVEEGDETSYWLEVIRDAEVDNSNELNTLLAEGEEIIRILSKIKSSHEQQR